MKTFIEIIPYLSGPASSVIILLIVIYLLVRYFVPVIKEYVDNQKEAFNRTLEQHEEDRKLYHDTLTTIYNKMDGCSQNIEIIKIDIRRIEDNQRKAI
tara:strand:- start:369 stop:662 length:294 start_codon:yes stop_codon:yes gene_type:complete